MIAWSGIHKAESCPEVRRGAVGPIYSLQKGNSPRWTRAHWSWQQGTASRAPTLPGAAPRALARLPRLWQSWSIWSCTHHCWMLQRSPLLSASVCELWPSSWFSACLWGWIRARLECLPQSFHTTAPWARFSLYTSQPITGECVTELGCP